MPELKPIRLVPGDVLYHQKDFADEIYMIKQGKVKLTVDLTDYLIREDASIFIQSDIDDDDDFADDGVGSFDMLNLSFAFIIYIDGSYFGDSDIFRGKKPYQRDSTAMIEEITLLFVLSR